MSAESSTAERPRESNRKTAEPTASPDTPPRRAAPPPAAPAVPTLLDFYPLEAAPFTRLSAFFDHLRAGPFTTTKCRRDGTLLWPPRVTCPKCHGEELDWVDLPQRGRVYAFSAVLVGAPLGMESDVPFTVGLIDLDGAPLRLFGRIDGGSWETLRIGDAVRVVPKLLEDGRVFYRFERETPAPDASSGRWGDEARVPK